MKVIDCTAITLMNRLSTLDYFSVWSIEYTILITGIYRKSIERFAKQWSHCQLFNSGNAIQYNNKYDFLNVKSDIFIFTTFVYTFDMIETISIFWLVYSIICNHMECSRTKFISNNSFHTNQEWWNDENIFL